MSRLETGGARVALLTNFLPPYRIPVLEALSERVGALRVIVSTAMEEARDWTAEWGSLDVEVQRSLTLPRRWRHPAGFGERIPLHIPLDTRARLDAFRPDVVISAELGFRSLHAARWCGRNGRPLLLWGTLSERTEEGRGRARRLLRRFLLRRADGAVVNGESGARYIRRYGYPDDRIHRVHQASPIRWGEEAGGAPAAGPLRLLYVGQLVERKGVVELVRRLDGWCESRQVPLELSVVGTGPLSEALEQTATGDRLSVRLEGSVPFDALDRHYRAADLLVFPTLADEWGLVVNEAMACGLPVLGSVYSQAVTELVEDGTTGWWYDPERPDELGDALDRIVVAGRPGLREMGAAARERVEGLTPGSMAEGLLMAVRAVLTAKSPCVTAIFL